MVAPGWYEDGDGDGYGLTESVQYSCEAPSDDFLQSLNNEFGDIVNRGGFTLSDALPDERDEPDLADLPRLIFQFDRRNLGRLRLLIDCLNEGTLEPAINSRRERPSP